MRFFLDISVSKIIMVLVALGVGICVTSIEIAEGGSGHQAGYDWAESNNVDDPSNCYSAHPGRWAGDNINNSQSFTEGCLEYLRDNGYTDEDDEPRDLPGGDDEDASNVVLDEENEESEEDY